MADPAPDAIIGTAVVTGAGSGIGRALAAALASRGVARLVIVDRNGDAAAQTAAAIRSPRAGPVESVALDVADPEAVAALVERIERQAPIGAWFSNAGVNVGQGLGTAQDWRTVLDVNLLAHVHAARVVLPRMEARGSGHFVITASAAGLLTDLRTAPYSASKHAAVGLAEWLAISVGAGVTVSCICPEGVLTGMTGPDSRGAAAEIAFLSAEEVAERSLDAIMRGEFLVLTHPRTAEYERRRTGDRPRWLAGMRAARARMLDTPVLHAATGADHG